MQKERGHQHMIYGWDMENEKGRQRRPRASEVAGLIRGNPDTWPLVGSLTNTEEVGDSFV